MKPREVIQLIKSYLSSDGRGILAHARLHAITSTGDHSSTATSGYMLKANANGLPVNATNTDAQVAAAVSGSHTRQHAITSTSDHTSSATPGVMLKADSNGLPVDSLSADAAVGDLKLLSLGGVVALGYNATTHERGYLTKYINRTGASSVKGTLVSLSQATDLEVIKQANEFDTIGIIAEAGIAEGSEMWVWKVGSRCQVLIKDTIAVTRGEILIAADTDGRAIGITNPGTGIPAVETHFKECGHICQSAGAGTNVLALCEIHFN